jgi:heat shock protein HslJ
MIVRRHLAAAVALATVAPAALESYQANPVAPTPFEGTTWNLTHLGDDPVKTSSPEREITLRFDQVTRRVTGSAGCNRLTGGYSLKDNAVSFMPLATTRMTCPDSALEARFLAALGKVATYQITGIHLELLGANGGLVASFDARPSGGALVFGDWRVVSFKAPGISAMTTAEAGAWKGTEASYGETRAAFGPDECTRPTYESRTMSVNEFAQEYRVSAADLGLSGPSLTLVTVTCASPWTNHGSVLIVKSVKTLVTTWDGVFFELERRTR